MSDDLSWTLQLVDEVSAPAHAMLEELKSLNAEIRTATENLNAKRPASNPFAGLDDGVKQSTAGIDKHRSAVESDGESSAASALEIGLWVEIAREGAEYAKEFATTIVELGEKFVETGIEASHFRAQAEAALGVFEGSNIGAQVAYEQIQQIATGAGVADDKAVEMYKSLRAVGLAGDEATQALKGALDVHALGFDENAFTSIIERIRSTGRIGDRALATLGQSGINTDALIREIAEARGVNEAAAKQLITDNKLSANESIKAILSAVRDTTGRDLGKYAEDFASGDTMSQLQRFKNEVGNLFEGVDAGPIASVIGELNEALGGDFGKRARADIEYTFGRIAYLAQEAADNPTVRKVGALLAAGLDDIPKAIDAVTPYIEAFSKELATDMGPALDALGPALHDLFGELGGQPNQALIVFLRSLAAQIALDVEIMAELIHAIADVKRSLMFEDAPKDGGAHWGQAITDGLRDNLLGPIGPILGEFKAHIGALPVSVREKLGIHSPSKVFEDIGRNTAEGFRIGLEGPDVDGAARNMLSPPSAPPTGGGAGGASRSAALTIGEINIHGGGDAKEIAGDLRAAVESEFSTLLEVLARESGASA